MNPSNIMTHMNGIEKLGGTNFANWKGDLMLVLAIMDRDNSFREEKPEEPVAQGDHETTLGHRKAKYEKAKGQWERSDRVTLMIMHHSIDAAIRDLFPSLQLVLRLSWQRLRSISKGPLRLMLACS
jgi:hypothetical protein